MTMANKPILVPLSLRGRTGASLTITANDTYSVRGYDSVIVQVDGGDVSPSPTPTPEPEVMALADYATMVNTGAYENNKIYNVII